MNQNQILFSIIFRMIQEFYNILKENLQNLKSLSWVFSKGKIIIKC